MEIVPRKLQFFGLRDIDSMPGLQSLTVDERFAMKVVANVFPFRINSYVVDELIDWSRIPEDPMFQLTFPQRGMLKPAHFEEMADLIRREAPADEVRHTADRIRRQLNPHPAGQMAANLPHLGDLPVPGVQHKYRETCLIFPSGGQTCHAYCSFCFRWPQFVGIQDLKFATDEANRYLDYIRLQRGVTDVLVTGGDPMIMSARKLATYIEPLLGPDFDHIQTIRIGTKSVAYWPHRFVTDSDSDDVLRLFEKVVRAGKHLALMGHFNHWKELSTDVAREAARRIRDTGAEIRTQSPLIQHVNDDPAVWARLWKEQVRLGCVPYYMFVIRDTGAMHYFSVPLFHAWQIYQAAYRQISGLGRTVRGPCMSAYPGKVVVSGVAEVQGEQVFVLRFLQARVPDHVQRPFFARFDPAATWLTDLVPAFGRKLFPYQRDTALPAGGDGHARRVDRRIGGTELRRPV